MSGYGPPCQRCGHPAVMHGITFCQTTTGSNRKRDCDCTGYDTTEQWEPLYRAEKARADAAEAEVAAHWKHNRVVIKRLRNERDAAEAAMARVRALHASCDCVTPPHCSEVGCGSNPYPCRTIAALDDTP